MRREEYREEHYYFSGKEIRRILKKLYKFMRKETKGNVALTMYILKIFLESFEEIGFKLEVGEIEIKDKKE